MRRLSRIRTLCVLGVVVLAISTASYAQIGISITIGPPALPVYEQPVCPGEGYIWTPGYWAYGPFGYYWVPGTWVMAPVVGYLWTPAWWGWGGSGFIFHEGYWGPRVGFYGGIVYGFGYFGHGYEGGRWEGDRFYYNRTVNNVNITNIHNVYNTTIINNTTVNRVSYNGGEGGIQARPTREEEEAGRERHAPPTSMQTQHAEAARGNPELRASVNHGKPSVAATPRPGAFHEHGAVSAKEAGGPYRAENERSVPRPGNNVPRPENNVPRPPTATHARDLASHARPSPPNTGNSKLDQKYGKQQEKLYAKQEQEHQKLQQKQERDHQQLEQQRANEVRRQQVEQKHQQQTQRMEQKHVEQQQHLQMKQQPPSHNQPRYR